MSKEDVARSVTVALDRLAPGERLDAYVELLIVTDEPTVRASLAEAVGYSK